MNGWVRLAREIVGWAWHDSPDTLSVLVHLLARSNFKAGERYGVVLRPGQTLFGREQLARDCGISERAVRTALKRLTNGRILTVESTNRYSIATFEESSLFSYDEGENDPPNAAPTTSKRPANDHTGIRETGSTKKRGTDTASRFTPPTVEEVGGYCRESGISVDPQTFVDFYASKGWLVGKSPMKDWRCTARNWARRDKQNGQQAAQSKPRVRFVGEEGSE